MDEEKKTTEVTLQENPAAEEEKGALVSSAEEVDTEALRQRIAVLENYREQAAKIRRSDKIATGVVGALLGALFALLVMIPFVFTLQQNNQPPVDDQQDMLVSDENSPFYGMDTEKIEEILAYLDAYFLYDNKVEVEKLEDAILSA